MTSAMLISSSVTEAYPAWAASNAYSVGSRVIRSTTNRIYERLVAGTSATPPEADRVNWMDFGPTNKWAMFDDQVSTASTAVNSLTVIVATGFIDSVGVVGASAYQAEIVMRDGLGGPVVHTESLGMAGDIVTDWSQYFFSDPMFARSLGLFQNLPMYLNTHLTLTLTGVGAIALGGLVFGRQTFLGETQYNPSAGITDYSIKDTDSFGVTKFVKRAYSKRLTCSLMVDRLLLNRVQRTLSDLRATPCLWIGVDLPEYSEPMVVFGFYRDFSTVIAYPNVSFCSLEIEGLI